MDDIRQYYALDDIAFGMGSQRGISKAQIKKLRDLTTKFLKEEKKRKGVEGERTARKRKVK
jgi:hypothetical protein